jgi:hypothetical protein
VVQDIPIRGIVIDNEHANSFERAG